MDQVQFDAIIAKNRLAQSIYESIKTGEPINANNALFQLLEIEKYTTEGNQPSINDIFTGVV